MIYYSSSVAPRILFPVSEDARKVAYHGVSSTHRGIAQLVEQRSPKPRAEGSSPSSPANYRESITVYTVR